MKKFIVYETSTGLARYAVDAESVEEVFVFPDMNVFEVPLESAPDISGFRAAVQGGQLIEIPSRPSTNYKWNGTVWEDPRPQSTKDEEAWGFVRGDRNGKLRASDWVMLPDAPVAGSLKAQWVTYRQALRDITNQTDPYNIQWPIPPE
jgi:hypothetical protein